MNPPVAVTIAGSDSGGGAGIQADLKTFAALRTYGASVVTAVTAQNTRDVRDIFALPANVVGAQVDAVLDDLPVAAVKVGMLATADIAGAVAVRARAGRLPNLVLDPVLTATTGRRLGVVAAIERLLPYATVVTPNAAEAAEILGFPIRSTDDMAKAAAQLGAAGPKAVVVTGADMSGADDVVVDVVWTPCETRLLSHPRLPTRNTHGTGCTYSAAVASRLAAGDDVLDAIRHAEAYVGRALAGARDWRIGNGAGPLDHFGWSV
jgi:hydroxymethylpyrimidine kinase/phosphomethylpyrimidine kinase